VKNDYLTKKYGNREWGVESGEWRVESWELGVEKEQPFFYGCSFWIILGLDQGI
jgi:hypothetical protein